MIPKFDLNWQFHTRVLEGYSRALDQCCNSTVSSCFHSYLKFLVMIPLSYGLNSIVAKVGLYFTTLICNMSFLSIEIGIPNLATRSFFFSRAELILRAGQIKTYRNRKPRMKILWHPEYWHSGISRRLLLLNVGQ